MAALSTDPHFIRELASTLDRDPDAAISAQDIASILDMDETATKQTLARLKREGFVERQPRARRMSHTIMAEPLTLTRAGWELAARIKRRPSDA